MRKINWLLALAAVAMFAVGCGSEESKTTTTTDTSTTKDTTTTDTTTGDTMMGDTMMGDMAMGDTTMADTATMTAEKGCLSASDKAYVDELGKDQTKAETFTNDTKSCTLGSCISKTTDAEGSACVGNCLVTTKKHPLSLACATCYGIRAFCTLNNCVKNPAEASSGCATNASGQACIDCQNKYKCVEAGENCKAGM
ncbi:MAG: hypothetical protein HY902_20740 [Deltaproteobacteria bacterium]|nr:hypothetical protein [Deltaproteobacteria bacterium]